MISSSLCYIEKDGKYLLIHRVKKKNDFNEGKWIGVGGKFEEDEMADECVVREVFEETGLTITKFYLAGVIKFYSNKTEDQDMYLYKATEFTGTLRTDCPEGNLKWVDADEVLKLPTWEGDHYFIKPLLQGKRNLNMTVKYEGDVLTEFLDETEPVLIEKALKIKSPHGFSTRIGGVSDGPYATLNLGMNRGDRRERVQENFRRFLEASGIKNNEFVCGAQVHGNYVHIAKEKDLRPAYGKGEMPTADGYVTNLVNVPLVIFTADCVPVILEDFENKVIGCIHCGWRSTVADIQSNAINKMVELKADTSKIHAAIGPAIDKCCFEVGPEVIEAATLLIGESIADFYTARENGKYMLNLRGVVKERFIQLGINPENIEMVGECTLCHPEKYYSHRYSDGIRGSLATVIELEA